MKTGTFLCATFGLALFSHQAQNVSLAFAVPGMNVATVLHDDKGDLFVAGFESRQLYGMDPNPYHPDENPATYRIRKYSASDGTMLWEKKIHSPKWLMMQQPVMAGNKVIFGGSFKEKLYVDGGLSYSAGGSDLFLGMIDPVTGNLQLRTDGRDGDEILHGLTSTPSGSVYVSGEFRKTVKFGYFSSVYDEPHSFMGPVDMNSYSPLWMQMARAIDGQPLASFHNLKSTNDFLYSQTHGKSRLVGTNCEFGYMTNYDRSNRWSYDGYCDGFIPEGSTYTGWSIYLGTSSDHNNYDLGILNYKGTSTSLRRWNASHDTCSHTIVLPGLWLTYSAFRSGDEFFAVGSGAGTGFSSQRLGFRLVQGHLNTGSIRDLVFIEPDVYNELHPMSIFPYQDDQVAVAGSFSASVMVGDKEVALSGGQENMSFVALVSRAKAVGISEQNEMAGSFVLSPNPARDRVKIGCTACLDKSEVVISDLYGKVVLWQNLNTQQNEEVRLPALRSGVYLVQVNNNGSTKSRKLIVE